MFVFVAFASGYAAAASTWPVIKTWVRGVAAEAAKLRAKADAMLTKAKIPGGK